MIFQVSLCGRSMFYAGGVQSILQGPISQRDLSPDLDLNLRLWF